MHNQREQKNDRERNAKKLEQRASANAHTIACLLTAKTMPQGLKSSLEHRERKRVF